MTGMVAREHVICQSLFHFEEEVNQRIRRFEADENWPLRLCNWGWLVNVLQCSATPPIPGLVKLQGEKVEVVSLNTNPCVP